MGSNPLRINVEVNTGDIANLAAASQQVSSTVAQMSQKFEQGSVSAKDIASSIAGTASALVSLSPQVQAQVTGFLNLQTALTSAKAALAETAAIIKEAGGTAGVSASMLKQYATETAQVAIAQKLATAASKEFKDALSEAYVVQQTAVVAQQEATVAAAAGAAQKEAQALAAADAIAVEAAATEGMVASDVQAAVEKNLLTEAQLKNTIATQSQALATTAALSGNARMAQQLLLTGVSAEKLSATLIQNGLTAEEAAAALAELGIIVQGLGEQAEGAAVKFSAIDKSIAYTAGRMGAFELGVGQLGFGFARLATVIPSLTAAMELLFIPFAAIAFFDIIEMGVQKFTKFREEIEKASRSQADLAVENYKTADSIELENLKIQGQINALEGMPTTTKLAVALLEAKIRAEELGKTLESDLEKSIKLLNVGFVSQFFSTASANEEQFKGKLQEIADKIVGINLALAEAPAGSDASKAAIDKQIAAYKEYGVQIDADIAKLKDESDANAEAMENAGAAGGTILPTNFDASITKLQQQKLAAIEAQHALEAMQKQGELKTTLGGLKNDKGDEPAETKNQRTADAFKKLAERQITAFQKMAETEVEIDDKTSEMFSRAAEKDTAVAIEAVYKKVDAEVKYHEEVNTLAERAALESITAEQAGAEGVARVRQVQLSGANVGAIARINAEKNINLDLIREEEKLAEAKLAVQLKYIEDQKKILLGGQTEQQFTVNADPAQLSKLDGLNRQIEAAQQAHGVTMGALANKGTEIVQKAVDDQIAVWQRGFNKINSGMENATREMLRGTVTVQEAFRRMGETLVLDIVTSLEQMVLKTAEREIMMTIIHATQGEARVAATASAAAQTKTIESISNLKSIEGFAAKAAAGAFTAFVHIPLIGPELGAAAAAATFVAVMALGALAGAEQGAVIPRDMPILAHGGEMVLPKHLSEGIGDLVAAGKGGGSGSSTSISVSALDAPSLRDFLHRNQRQFAGQMKGLVRNGMR